MELGARYYQDYGLAIRGLIKHFTIDPVEYDKFVDGALELEHLLERDDHLISLLMKCKARIWVFTNAGKYHALRVLKLTGLLDTPSLLEGVVYCNYSEENFPSKPDRLAYERAMLISKVDQPELIYFADDSRVNVASGIEMGWRSILIDEELEEANSNKILNIDYSEGSSNGPKSIRYIHELPLAFPELFGSPLLGDNF